MKKQVRIKEFTVTIADNGSVEVYRTYKDTLAGLQELARKIKLKYLPSWGEYKLGTVF